MLQVSVQQENNSNELGRENREEKSKSHKHTKSIGFCQGFSTSSSLKEKKKIKILYMDLETLPENRISKYISIQQLLQV